MKRLLTLEIDTFEDNGQTWYTLCTGGDKVAQTTSARDILAEAHWFLRCVPEWYTLDKKSDTGE